jgi:hypothetical protein
MEPTEKQLQYLKRLGYDGPPPQTRAEASAAIDALKDGQSGAKAIQAQRKESAKRLKKSRADSLKSAKEQIRFMLKENCSQRGA